MRARTVLRLNILADNAISLKAASLELVPYIYEQQEK